MRLVLASNNAKKLAELRAVLQGLTIELIGQKELGIAEAEEPHATFLENALAKARHASAASGLPALADDSGLCVRALGGAPGVISAHYAGLMAMNDAERAAPEGRERLRRRQDEANNAALLAQLAGVADRHAHFLSTLVAVRSADDPEPLVASGRWPGEVLQVPRGEGGFGYDPLMWLPEHGLTVAELDGARKNRLSHRARAAAQLRELLQTVWGVQVACGAGAQGG